VKFLFRRKKPKSIILRPKGTIYDLQKIYSDLNQEYFDAKLDLRISWFGRGETVPKTRITFGSYNPNLKLIKVNRLLDKEHIPDYFVRFIVYHEMLHNSCPPKRRKKGTHHIHHSEFKAKEREFPQFKEVTAFIQKWKKTYFPQLK